MLFGFLIKLDFQECVIKKKGLKLKHLFAIYICMQYNLLFDNVLFSIDIKTKIL